MLWGKDVVYQDEPFELESELEAALQQVAAPLFGADRFYLDVKKKLARRSGRGNIPDGYLIDLASPREPRLFVVENEISRHEPLKHIAVQILEFSLAFETSPQRVKEIVKEALRDDADAFRSCEEFAATNGLENVDLLLERMIHGESTFNALVIIDEVSEDLEHALVERFKFPVEIITLKRYRTPGGKRLYEFEPFLADVAVPSVVRQRAASQGRGLDVSEVDTIVVPARDDGFEETFLGENRWYKIRIHSSMIPRIKHIAAYRVAPTSAITHVADVAEIRPWPNSSKYEVVFTGAARKIRPVGLVSGGQVRALQAARYTSLGRLERAKTLDEAF